VSPLATARISHVDRARENGQTQNLSSGDPTPTQPNGRNIEQRGQKRNRKGSPAPGRMSPNSRKQSKRRKKDMARQERTREGAIRTSRSPVPYIKEEPTSPLPFAAIPETHTLRRRPVYAAADEVDLLSPRTSRGRSAYQREFDIRLGQRAPEPDELSSYHMGGPLRTTHRSIQREDQELRRVASLQYARRPYSPGVEVGGYSSTRGVRAASYALVEPQPRPPIYRSGSIRPDQLTRNRSPPILDDSRSIRPRSPLVMGPPPAPRPMFMDEHGNIYTVPGPSERPMEITRTRASNVVEPFERSSSRPVTRLMEVYEDDSMPRIVVPRSRKHVESNIEYTSQRAQAPREYSSHPTGLRSPGTELVPVREPQILYEEMPPPITPREYDTRAYSVRPEFVRREVPVDYVARHESVQPGRDSIRRGEIAAPPYLHDAVPAADRSLVYPIPQTRRHVEEAVDAGTHHGEIRRSSYRYQ
jgi:hypothetical protein